MIETKLIFADSAEFITNVNLSGKLLKKKR
jgi:hypothetical protein